MKATILNSGIPHNERRFLELANENQAKLRKICRVYAWNRADQDDLYQEILLQIWRGVPSLKNDDLATTWLYRVTLNTAMTFVRKKNSRGGVRTATYDHTELEQISDAQPPGFAVDEQVARLYEAIAQLNDLEKALITLFLEDLTYEEMAAITGLSESNVGVMLHRVKKKLANLIKEIP